MAGFNYKNNSNVYALASLLLNHNIQNFTATAGQTTFVIADGYAVGAVYVIVNGQWLSDEDFTATDGTNVVLTVGATVGDQVEVVALGSFSVLDSVLQTASQTTFTPAGSIAATNVQNALEELDTEKLASTSYTAADVLAKLLTVDGTGSGLDADTLDGIDSTSFALLASPALTGNPTAPTQSPSDNSTKLATTEYVDTAISVSTAAPYITVAHTASAGTTGGAYSVASTWQQRVFNSTIANTITGASLSGGNVTLPAGTYTIDGRAAMYSIQRHTARLYNVSDGTAVSGVYGTSGYESTLYPANSWVRMTGTFTIAASKIFRLEQIGNTTDAAGFGSATNLGVTELYSHITITKVG